MKVVIDPETCVGHGRCYTLVPSIFDADDDGFGVVINPEVDLDPQGEDRARVAVANCPETAISLVP